MGMFDELTVEHPLPDGMDPTGIVFQSKDTTEQGLVRFLLRKDSALWNTETGDPVAFHGALHFYTSNWAGSCGRVECTTDDAPPWRAEYTALYDHGRLLKIDGPGRRLVEAVEHVPRAEFFQICEQRRKAEALPGEDLYREWVHWMTFAGDPFEAAKLPATRARLSYLRGRGAWGMRIRREDQIPDLRDWSTWLAGEADLSEDAQDLLARTRKFLAAHDQRSALEAAFTPRGEA